MFTYVQYYVEIHLETEVHVYGIISNTRYTRPYPLMTPYVYRHVCKYISHLSLIRVPKKRTNICLLILFL